MKRPAERAVPSIRLRLALLLGLSLAAVMSLNVWWNHETADRPLLAWFDHGLRDDAYIVASHVRTEGGKVVLDLPPGAEYVLRTDPDDEVFFEVKGPQGQVLAGDPQLSAGIDDSEDRALDTVYRGNPVRAVVLRHPTAAGPVTIIVAKTTWIRDAIRDDIVSTLLISNGLLMAVTLALVYVGVGVGLAPLMRLRDEIAAERPDALRPVSEHGLPAEVLPLARALNQTLALIQESRNAQRKFLDDASHQLRTPLATLQGHVEMLAAEDMNPSQHERVLFLGEMTRRLAHLANRLLAIARTDGEAVTAVEFADMDLASVVEDSAALFIDRADAKHIDIGFEAAPAPVRGSLWMLGELAGNLIDNAINHTPEGGRITVRSFVQDASACLEVEDSGPGVPEEERGRIFERFYRGTGASAVGCGLGLAIVAEIARAHGATVSVRPADGGGSVFRVVFPPAGVARA